MTFQDVTMQWPTPGFFIGPGVNVSFIGTLSGPIDASSVWVLELRGSDNETFVSQQELPWDGQVGLETVFGQLGAVNHSTLSDQIPTAVPQTGDSVFLHVRLHTPAGDLGDTAFEYKYDGLGQLSREIEDVAAAAGGLTEQEKQQLQAAAEQTAAAIQAQGGQILAPVSDLITHVAAELSTLIADPIIFTEPGTITFSQLQVHFAQGLWWEFLDVPPQLARAERTQFHYHQVMVELREFHQFVTGPVATQITQWHTDRIISWFAQRSPSQIDVWVYPGLTVAMHYVSSVF